MIEKKISARQTGMVCVILIFANNLLILPSLLFQDVGSDGFWVVFMLLAFDLLTLGAFFMLKSYYPHESFYEILQTHLGKIVAKIIIFSFLIFFLIKSLLAYSVKYMFLKKSVYQDEFELLAFICLIPVINHAVISGLRTISRTIELFFYVIIAGIIICLGISLTNVWGNPLFFKSSPEAFFNTSFQHLLSFGDYLFLFLIMDKIEIKKGQGRKILNFVFLGIFLLLAILLAFYCIYRVTAFMHNSAIADIISISAQFSAIGRLDIISMLVIMFLTYFQLELFVYGFCNSFVILFPKLNRIHAIVFYDIIFIVLYFGLLSQFDLFITSLETYAPYLMILVNYIVPLITVFISLKARKRREYEKIF